MTAMLPETSPQERGFLSRQKYRLETARDTLDRELANHSNRGSRDRVRDWEADRAAVGRSADTLADEVEAMLQSKLEDRLSRVVRALEKLAEGTYGLCDVTGSPIGRSRLEYVPEETESAEGRRLSRPEDRSRVTVCKSRKSAVS